eukprot:TRINITY_DN31071_c0_g1_i1.p1 TRINITY_DN31071_c0_g1~~TRINITY_DN31071_c0_g1_i1.p1  ORF type:complete len:534 (+),score=78.11 TRINITY_DN31071_c0_g1_i1:47-1648(+)
MGPCRAAIKVLAGLSFVRQPFSHVAPDFGFEHLYDESPEESPEHCAEVQSLPAFLDGTFVIQSIAKLSMGEQRLQAWLDAFFKVHTLSISDKRLCHKSRIIRSGYYNNSVKKDAVAAGVLFLEAEPPRSCAPLPGGLCNLGAPNDNNFAATYRVKSGDSSYRYALTTDQADHLDFDMDSLDVIGKRKFQDHFTYPMHMPMGGGTHLQCEAGKGQSATKCDGDLYGVVMEQPTGPGKPNIDLYRIRQGSPFRRELVAHVPVPFLPGGMHSFGLTHDYAILPLQPYTLNTESLMAGHDIMHSIDTKGNMTPIYLVNLHNGSVQTFHSEVPLFYVHFVNSWQNGSHVVFDVSVFDKQPFSMDDPGMVLSVLRNKSARDASDNTQTIRRYTLDLARGVVTEQKLTSSPSLVDFPTINPAKAGNQYCIYYGVEWKHDGESYGSMALRKHNTCTGSVTFFHEPHNFVSEGFFVSNGGAAEDDGVVLAVVLDGSTRASSFVVLDARNMQKIASYTFQTFLAMTAHGAWYPNEQRVFDITV